MNRKVPFAIFTVCIFILGLILFRGLEQSIKPVIRALTHVSADGEDVNYIPGSKCPVAEDPGMASICGKVINSGAELVGGRKIVAGGIPNATVALYEALPGTTTGKDKGSLGHLFSSTTTTLREDGFYEAGRFHLTMRRIGPPGFKVYLAIFCDGNFDLLTFASAKDMTDLTIPINCSGNGVPGLPPLTLDFTNRVDLLGCTAEVDSTLTMVSQGSAPTTVDHFTTLTEFDGRHKKNGNPNIVLGGGYINFELGETHGGLWSKDCERLHPENPALCHTPDSNPTDHLTWEEFATAISLDFVPKQCSGLPYRSFINTEDLTAVYQDPTHPVGGVNCQLGGCVPSDGEFTHLRYFGEPENDLNLLPCDYFLECKDSQGKNSSVRNSQTCGAPASCMGSSSVWEQQYASSDLSAYVCKQGGAPIQLCKIQPPWSICDINDPECEGYCGPYSLPEYYFRPEYMLPTGSARVPSCEQTTNDSFTGNCQAPRPEAHVFGGGTEAQFGTITTATNTFLANEKNEGPRTSAVSALALTSDQVTGKKFSDVFDHPFAAEYGGLQPKGTPVGSIGNPMSICALSYVAGYNPEVTPSTEPTFADKLIKTFQGIQDATRNDQMDSPTPQRTVYMSSTAILREKELALNNEDSCKNFNCWQQKVLDAVLTACGGGNTVDLGCAVEAAGQAAYGLFIYGPGAIQVMANRTDELGDNPQPMDDLRVTYPLCEESFDYNSDNQIFPAYADPNNPGYPGSHECYPWTPVALGHVANEEKKAFPGGNPPDGGGNPEFAVRTLRIDHWETYTKAAECECAVDGGVYTSCEDPHIERTGIGNDPTYPSVKPAEACLQEQYASIFPAENTDNCPENQVCLDEEHVDDQLEDPVLPTIGVDHCPANKKKKTFTSPDPDYPACALSFAGPNICAGSLSKDTTLNIAPKKDETTLNTDFISRASNSMVFAFWPPSKDMPLYRAVMQLDSRATSSAEAPNLHDGKETKGVGGPNASFLEIAKHPLYFNTLVNYLPIKYWCSDTTGILPAGSGAWDCTIQDVPEEITLEDLLDMAEGGCSLSGSCAPPTIPQGMSFEMQAVINAAAAAYNVPAGMIVAAMNGVNGFLSPYTGIWQLADEEDVGIPWWGRIPVDGCDDFASGEQGPYDILIGYFYPQAVEIVSKGRSVTASRCNFLDATFSVAYGLASASSPGSCSDWSEQLKVDALCTFAVGADPLGAHQEFCATTVANDWMAVANACSE